MISIIHLKRPVIYCELGIIIPLTQYQFTIIDFEDEKQCQFNWCACFNSFTKSFYAGRDNGNLKLLYLHRDILLPSDEFDIDHQNHDTLDNRRCNLRIVTTSQNQMNKSKQSNNLSGKTGVIHDKYSKKYRARIMVNKKQIHLGYFSTIEKATEARYKAELKYFGEFRCEL